MPKRSKKDTEITIQTIVSAVEDQLLMLGYDKMSYTTLSKQTGISRTGISHHFPKKTDFMLALDNRIYALFMIHLNVDEDLQAFSDSWIRSLDNPAFISILRLLFHHVISGEKAENFSKNWVDRLYQMLGDKFGSVSKKELEWLLGISLNQMSD